MLYVLAFGKLPFQGDHKLAILYAKYEMPPTRSPELRSLIAELLVADPDKRPDIQAVIARFAPIKHMVKSSYSHQPHQPHPHQPHQPHPHQPLPAAPLPRPSSNHNLAPAAAVPHNPNSHYRHQPPPASIRSPPNSPSPKSNPSATPARTTTPAPTTPLTPPTSSTTSSNPHSYSGPAPADPICPPPSRPATPTPSPSPSPTNTTARPPLSPPHLNHHQARTMPRTGQTSTTRHRSYKGIPRPHPPHPPAHRPPTQVPLPLPLAFPLRLPDHALNGECAACSESGVQATQLHIRHRARTTCKLRHPSDLRLPPPRFAPNQLNAPLHAGSSAASAPQPPPRPPVKTPSIGSTSQHPHTSPHTHLNSSPGHARVPGGPEVRELQEQLLRLRDNTAGDVDAIRCPPPAPTTTTPPHPYPTAPHLSHPCGAPVH